MTALPLALNAHSNLEAYSFYSSALPDSWWVTRTNPRTTSVSALILTEAHGIGCVVYMSFAFDEDAWETVIQANESSWRNALGLAPTVSFYPLPNILSGLQVNVDPATVATPPMVSWTPFGQVGVALAITPNASSPWVSAVQTNTYSQIQGTMTLNRAFLNIASPLSPNQAPQLSSYEANPSPPGYNLSDVLATAPKSNIQTTSSGYVIAWLSVLPCSQLYGIDATLKATNGVVNQINFFDPGTTGATCVEEVGALPDTVEIEEIVDFNWNPSNQWTPSTLQKVVGVSSAYGSMWNAYACLQVHDICLILVGDDGTLLPPDVISSISCSCVCQTSGTTGSSQDAGTSVLNAVGSVAVPYSSATSGPITIDISLENNLLFGDQPWALSKGFPSVPMSTHVAVLNVAKRAVYWSTL